MFAERAPIGEPAFVHADHTRPRQKVLFIMGMTRSGSTILANVLGGVEGFFSAGEIRLLWKRGVQETRACACGSPVGRCDVWSQVLDTMRDGDGRIDEDVVLALQRNTVRLKHTWGLARREPATTESAGLDYPAVVSQLIRAVADLTDARVIVDSSKRPSDGALLRLLPALDVYYVHLVRDPRAVAYSWRRLRSSMDHGGPRYMARHGPTHSTARWTYRNLGARAVARRVDPERFMLVRYETFSARPRQVIESIVRFVGEDVPDLPFVDDAAVLLDGNHMLSGNPSRFASGVVQIREDREWIDRQRPLDRAMSTLFALPLLPTYRYPVLAAGRYVR